MKKDHRYVTVRDGGYEVFRKTENGWAACGVRPTLETARMQAIKKRDEHQCEVEIRHYFHGYELETME